MSEITYMLLLLYVSMAENNYPAEFKLKLKTVIKVRKHTKISFKT